MATKSKNKIIFVIWTFLLTLGLSGLLFFFSYGLNYIHKDYFHTPEFQSELDQFAGYLNMFKLNHLSLEEAKKSLTVTDEDIQEHRYRYGTLPEQIENLNQQYEERIQGALAAENQEAADAFIQERDTKIEDITKNFQSDEHVRPKVIKEKEQRLKEYYKERENYRWDYIRYEKAFSYYFKDTVSGKVFTNLPEEESPEDILSSPNILFATNYTIPRDYTNYFGIPGDELVESFLDGRAFEGYIAIPKSLSPSDSFMIQYKDYKQDQMILIVYVIASFIALFVCFLIGKKRKGLPVEMEKWRTFYNKIPLDIRAAIWILFIFIAIISIFLVNDSLLYVLDNSTSTIRMFIFMVSATCCWGLTIVQWKFLLPEIKNWENVKEEWEKGLLNKARKKVVELFKQVLQGLTEAFLNQSTGTQLLIVLAAVFGLGFSAIIVVLDPFFLLFYMILLGVVGIPLIIGLVNRIGYFNRIIEKTNELAVGNLGPDLIVTGKSVLATLAGNINVLKQGVKTSKNEQAKSERLKTELITNVSHDLRTPLTSIINYTELLKKGGRLEEDQKSYLEIIDQKSKRLKVLIDDLFEVSKMASGNMKLNKEKVDLVQLLHQALAEHDDKINASSLQFRVTNTEKPIFAFVDGQKLWRVFDNLIGNILKYSLDYSRVYIHVSKMNTRAMISFKNISKYELNDNSEELFERFKRGDTSRHTEGSGLGLAIAKSIIDLHEGSLEIETDGDLFKVSITLQLVE